jgi:mannose-1-phosphate guanylyltransferase
MPLLDRTYAILMAGGRGSRFWPVSNKKSPKQFLKIIGDQSMLQITFDRVTQLVGLSNIYVVTEKGFQDKVSQQLPELATENILEEPMGKSTAAAVGFAAMTVLRKCQDATLLLLPSDHYINNLEQFLSTVVSISAYAAENDALCTIGVSPTAPETGYGYIQLNEVPKKDSDQILKVKRFVEKPDIYTAIEYLKEGRYLWNSGIFIFNSKTLLEAILCYMPGLFKGLEKLKELPFPYPEKELSTIYESFENVSIDYGIMEKAENVFCVPGDFGWSDTGSWTALNKFIDKDEHGNIVQGEVINIGCKDCILVGDETVAAGINLRNLIVVSSKKGVLVCHKDNSQEVKKIVSQLEKQNKTQFL